MIHSPRRRIISFVSILLLWVAFDLSTKKYIFSILPDPGYSITVIEGYVRLTHVKNRGAVWGMFQNAEQILYVLNLFVVPFLFVFFLRALYSPGFIVSDISWPFVVAAGLIMGGAAGNLCDRVTWGYVRDFIDVTIPVINYRWPTFNVADAGITVGACILAICILVNPPEE